MMATISHHQRLINGLIGTAIITFALLLHVIFPNTGATGQTLPFNGAMWMGFFLMIALAVWPVTHGKVQFSAFHQGLALLLLALWQIKLVIARWGRDISSTERIVNPQIPEWVGR